MAYSPSIRYGQSKTLAYNEKGIRFDSEIDSWLLPIGDLDKAINCCVGHGTFPLTIQRLTGWLLCLAPAQSSNNHSKALKCSSVSIENL